jgi:tetratricopeptide (TPR) repeat protein
MNSRRFTLLAGVALVLAGVVVYQNSLEAPFLFDDTPAIVDNRSIRHLWPPGEALSPPANAAGATGRPLVNLTLAVNYALGGLAVRGYHVMNLCLHLLATLTLWGVLRRTWRRPALQVRFGPDTELLAGCAALLWAVHPLLTESVTCVVQRTEVLGGLFYLLTLYGFIRSVGVGRVSDPPSRPVKDRSYLTWSMFSVLACLLGMASKEIVATAPLLVLLYDRTFVAGTFREAWRRRKIFYGALAATWILLAWLMGHAAQRAGTVGFGLGVSPWEYLLTQCRALTLYLKLSFWPHPLVVDYGVAVVKDVREVWPQGLIVVALLLVTLRALWRRPVLGFIGAAFFVILAPSSSFVPLVTQTMAEHRMYLPLAAVIVLAVAGLHNLFGRHTAAVCLLLAAVLGAVTMQRNGEYCDDLAVWSGVIVVQPDNARAHIGLGAAYYNRGDLAAAMPHYEESRRLEPRAGQIYYDLGLVMDKLDRPEEAAKYFAQAVKLVPAFAPAQAELGDELIRQGRMEEAIQHLQIAVTSAPDLTAARNSLGRALAGAGRMAEAIAIYETALKGNPGFADLHFNLALALVSAGRADAAFAQYTEAVRLKPAHAEARLNLGIMLAQRGRLNEALVQLHEAARLRPKSAEAQANLGIALAETGRVTEAVGSYEAALRLRPDYAVAHYNLGNALIQLQRWPEAKRHFAEAVRLAPDFAAAREMLERMQAVPVGP